MGPCNQNFRSFCLWDRIFLAPKASNQSSGGPQHQDHRKSARRGCTCSLHWSEIDVVLALATKLGCTDGLYTYSCIYIYIYIYIFVFMLYISNIYIFTDIHTCIHVYKQPLESYRLSSCISLVLPSLREAPGTPQNSGPRAPSRPALAAEVARLHRLLCNLNRRGLQIQTPGRMQKVDPPQAQKKYIESI